MDSSSIGLITSGLVNVTKSQLSWHSTPSLSLSFDIHVLTSNEASGGSALLNFGGLEGRAGQLDRLRIKN